MSVQQRKRPARELDDRQLVNAAARDLTRRRQYTTTRNFGVMGDDDYDTCAQRCGHSIGPGDRFQQVIIDGAPRRQHLDCPGRY